MATERRKLKKLEKKNLKGKKKKREKRRKKSGRGNEKKKKYVVRFEYQCATYEVTLHNFTQTIRENEVTPMIRKRLMTLLRSTELLKKSTRGRRDE